MRTMPCHPRCSRDASFGRSGAASRAHTLLPGTLTLGEPFLVDDEHLCLANTENVSFAPFHSLAAAAGPLRSWADRRALALWNPEAGCFDRELGWPAATNASAARVVCLPVRCGSELICEALGMNGECAAAEQLQHALQEPSALEAAGATLRGSVEQATLAANASSLACAQLQAVEQETSAAFLLQAQRVVWRRSAGSAHAAGEAAAQQLARHVANQLQSARDEQLPILVSLIEADVALATWSGWQALTDSKRTLLDTVLECAANTTVCNTSSTSVQLAVQTFLQQAHSLLGQLELDGALGSERLGLLQLEVELVAQVTSAALWLYYLVAATSIHTALDGRWQARSALPRPERPALLACGGLREL